MSAASGRVPLWFILKHDLIGYSEHAPWSSARFRTGKCRGRLPWLLNPGGKLEADVGGLRQWVRVTLSSAWINWEALEWAAANPHDLARYNPTKKEGV